MRLYFKYFSMQIKSVLEYRKTFIITLISQIATSIFCLLSIVFLFQKFGNIEGYTFDEVIICFSISFLGYTIAECFFRAFDHFDRMISNGEFDRILVRPRNIVFQVLGSKIELVKLGRAGAAIVTFIVLLIKNPELLAFNKFITLMLMIAGTIVIYGSLFILKAGITFYTTQSLELMNIFTDGARELAQYPLNIYQKWVLKFFTYILPLALVNYYPLQYLINRSNNKLYILLPLLTIVFTIPCYMVWKAGLKKYKSTGS